MLDFMTIRHLICQKSENLVALIFESKWERCLLNKVGELPRIQAGALPTDYSGKIAQVGLSFMYPHVHMQDCFELG